MHCINYVWMKWGTKLRYYAFFSSWFFVLSLTQFRCELNVLTILSFILNCLYRCIWHRLWRMQGFRQILCFRKINWKHSLCELQKSEKWFVFVLKMSSRRHTLYKFMVKIQVKACNLKVQANNKQILTFRKVFN